MKNAFRYTVAGLLLAVAGGCNDSDPGEVIPGLEVSDVQLTVQELVLPINASVEATVGLQDAFSSLLSQGFEFDRVDPGMGATNGLRVPLPKKALPVTIPEAMLGQTFVYDAQQDTWTADPSRTQAPADGVRTIWYDLDGLNNLILPLVERGFVDLVPADTGRLSRLHVRIVDEVDGTQLTLNEFTHGYRVSDTDPDTAVYEASGFYTSGPDTTDFVMYSETVDSETDGNLSYDFSIDASWGNERYLLEMEGQTDPTTSELTEEIVGVVEQGSVHTVLTINRIASPGSDEQGGTLTYNGEVVANVVLEGGGQFEFTPPGGGVFSRAQRQDLTALTQTLTLTGLNLVQVMPLLFPN